MPRFDGTGPFGQGPMGRGMGPCGAGRGGGLGYGFGPGFRGVGNFTGNRPRWGRGAWGGGYAAPQDEVNTLKQEASSLQNALDAINKRLSELEGA
jgi:hypothetical protein